MRQLVYTNLLLTIRLYFTCGARKICSTIKKPQILWTWLQIWYFKFYLHKLFHICYVDKKIILMMPSRLSYDLATIYRPETKKQNEDRIWCLKIEMRSWVWTLSDMLVWLNNFINDVIMTVTWPCYNLKNRHKIRTRFGVSCST